MKKLLVASVLLNVGLAIAFAVHWRHSAWSLQAMMEGILTAEEFHVKVHAKSLAALEAEEPENVEELKYLLRRFVEGWEEGAEGRESLRRAFR